MPNLNIQFLVGQADNGEYIALSKVEPFFCLQCPTQAEVIEAALKAWKFYLDFEAGNHSSCPQVQRTSPFRSRERHFIPSQVIYATA